jgi:3-oxoacyl-[acyl-carrier-protein] synthase-3
MALFSIENVSIEGVAASVPKKTADNLLLDLLTEKERELFVKTVGIRYRRIAPQHITAADLCFEAAQKILTETNTSSSEISGLIFVTQTPDYLIPNTASILQHKLGLPKSCIAFDVNLGCSGYVYGLSLAASFASRMEGSKILLLVGDVSTKVISQRDKSVVPLFSDAGSATIVSHKKGSNFYFNLQTDGAEFDDIIIRDGGIRNPTNNESFIEEEKEPGIFRNNLQMKLDGIRIFNFALREVVPNIHALYEKYNLNLANTNFIFFHQANKLMLESVRKKLNVEAEKVPYSLYDFGNTSSATIPLTMVANTRKELSENKNHLLLCGFGVGLSWGSVFLETQNICIPELIEVE